VIFLYSLLFTGLTSFFGVMIIPDSVRPNFFANLIGGISMYLVGPDLPKLFFHAFVVLVGVLILAGALNTSIVGANGVLNRIAEDGVLTPWFQRPQKRYGTSFRIINLIVGLQIFTIIASRGNVYLLAALYAFGVIWSFSFNALAVLRLRYTQPENREFKVPGNFNIAGKEIPVGLVVIAIVLFATAIINLFTKEAATVAGILFSGVFFVVFTVSERYTHRRMQGQTETLEQFRVFPNPELDTQQLSVRPGNALVPVRDPSLYYLRDILQRTDTPKQDVVVMTARLSPREHSFGGNRMYEAKEIFDTYEQELFSRVVAVAEKEGKPVSLLVVPGTDVFDSIMLTAQRLDSAKIVCGLSTKLTADEQAKLTGDAWERLPEPKPRLMLEIVAPDSTRKEYFLGPHSPRLRDEDLARLHQLWLQLTSDASYAGLHHYDVVALALMELERELTGPERDRLMKLLRQEMEKKSGGAPPS
jgi:nucleotide-binding universal stress UspA family protein